MVGVQTHKDPLFAETVLAGLEWAAMLSNAVATCVFITEFK